MPGPAIQSRKGIPDELAAVLEEGKCCTKSLHVKKAFKLKRARAKSSRAGLKEREASSLSASVEAPGGKR